LSEPNTISGPDEGIGRRIARKRSARGLTQQGLADLSHVSRSLVQQVELGRRTATPSFVAAVATALQVDPAEIYGQPYHGATVRTNRVHTAVDEMRRALICIDIPDVDVPPRALAALAAEVTNLRKLSQAARHVQVGVRIPAVLNELSVHAHDSDDPRAWSLLNSALAIAVALARRLGYNDLASFGIERAAAAALRSDDPNLSRLAELSRALLMMTIGAWKPGMKLVEQAAARVDRDSDQSRAVYGALHLRSAILSARAKRPGDAWEHHGLAAEVARQLPTRVPDFYGLQFNPPNVAIHGVAVAVELDDFDEAIRLDSVMKMPVGMPAERRAHHEIDMGRALVSAGQWERALHRLTNAERAAPQMTRFHPMARESVARLVDHHRRLPEPLRVLQDHMGLA
jgi:transcriptional regulator with XRE-family HTH domain